MFRSVTVPEASRERPSLTADKHIMFVPVALNVSMLETTTRPTIDPTADAQITEYLNVALWEELIVLPSFLMIHGAC